MSRKRRRLWILVLCGLGLSTSTALALMAFRSSLQFFVSPSQLASESFRPDQTLRLGGLVEQGSVSRASVNGQPTARFRVSDGAKDVEVNYTGILPDLFREGQGIVALGTRQPDGTFKAYEVLAKHDANYMPKEVEEALKKSGHWNPSEGPPPPADTWNTLTAKGSGG